MQEEVGFFLMLDQLKRETKADSFIEMMMLHNLNIENNFVSCKNKFSPEKISLLRPGMIKELQIKWLMAKSGLQSNLSNGPLAANVY